MKKVKVEIENATVDGRPGLRGRCTDCGHVAEVCGRGGASRRAALAGMRNGCPRRAEARPVENFYVDADDATPPPAAPPRPKPRWEPERPPWMT